MTCAAVARGLLLGVAFGIPAVAVGTTAGARDAKQWSGRFD